MIDNLGQKSSIWDNWWGGITTLSEIQMWDYYGGRQWITKYCPRYGKVIEAGCGAGRYVFYLRRLGIDIEGIDFSDSLIDRLNEEKSIIDKNAVFIKSDVTKLPFEDNSLSGYISLGVVEHFIEGPQKAIAEAFRVLRPGGIAIITTPNKSWFIRVSKFITGIKTIIKKILFRKISNAKFFQYEYTPGQLKKFLKQQGFYVSRAEGCDLLYPFNEAGKFKGDNLKPGKFAYWFADRFENTWIKRYGAQSITISIKLAPVMYCFLSGKLIATPDSLGKFDVPISKEMYNTVLAAQYHKEEIVRYASSYSINPPMLEPEKRVCEYSGKEYLTDKIFEDFGFNKNVIQELLLNPEINIPLCISHIKPIFRKRIHK